MRFSAFALIAVAACAAPNSPTRGGQPAATLSTTSADRVVLVESLDAPGWPADPIAITDGSIKGDTIVLAVQHGGGCRDHDYRLLVATIWMESYPVQVPARLSHNANGDACRALLSRELRISLLPLRDEYRKGYRTATGKIAIRLDGFSKSLVYEF